MPNGIGVFLVPGNAKGISKKGYPTQDGLHAADVTFTGVEVGADAAIGDPENGLALIERVVDDARIALCAEAVGAMDESLKTTVEYLKTRTQFGVPIGSFQTLQHRAADMFVAVEQARSMSLFATMASDFDDAKERATAVAAAKVQIGKSAKFVGQQAIQLHGGIGMTQEAKIGHYFKRLTMIENTFGDTDYHLRRVAGGGGLVLVQSSFRGDAKASNPESRRFRVWSFGPSRNDVKGTSREKHPVRSHRQGRRRHRLQPRHRPLLGRTAGKARRESRDLQPQGRRLR